TIMSALIKADSTEDILDLLESEKIDSIPASDWSSAAPARQRLLRTLRRLATSEPAAELPRQVAAYQPWCQRLVRYSFHPRPLVNAADIPYVRGQDDPLPAR